MLLRPGIGVSRRSSRGQASLPQGLALSHMGHTETHVCFHATLHGKNRKSKSQPSGPWNCHALLQFRVAIERLPPTCPWTGIRCALFLAQDRIFDEIDIDSSGKTLS